MSRSLFFPRTSVLLAVAAVAAGSGRLDAQECTATPGVLPEMPSRGGVLRGTLSMAPATYTLGGRRVTSNVYNGSYNAPTLRVDLGERVELTIENNMEPVPGAGQDSIDVTNQHYHGLVVTPIPLEGDNVTHVAIRQDSSNVNRYPLLPAADSVQSEGLMWYHPHPHDKTLPQVAGGLAGAMVVGNLLRHFPEYRNATERILVVKRNNSTFNINGVECPRLTLDPANDELWRILNASGNNFLNLKLAGYTFMVLAFDGNRVVTPMEQDSLFIPPGGRIEAIVRGGSGPWKTTLVSGPVLGETTSSRKLADVVVRGATDETQAEVEAVAAAAQARVDVALADSIRRIATATDVDRFTLTFDFKPRPRPVRYLLNDSVFNPDRLDRAVQVGRVQEWTLINKTTFPHTFHIHQTDFLITSINGRDVEADSVFFDNVTVGVHQIGNDIVGDTVVVRFKFHPVAVGPFVYHCHVLEHEDGGMMQNICVYPENATPAYCLRWFPASGGHAH